MFHAICSISTDESVQKIFIEKIIKDQHINIVDVLVLAADSLGVEDIKKLRQFLHIKPYASPSKLAAIYADTLSREAQHTLLKTLEEPPANCLIIVCARNTQNLIATILSRCTVIDHHAPTTKVDTQKVASFWRDVITSSIGNRMELARQLPTDRTEMQNWINEQMVGLHQAFIDPKQLNSPLSRMHLTAILSACINTNRLLEQNTSVKLAVDQLLLAVPRITTG